MYDAGVTFFPIIEAQIKKGSPSWSHNHLDGDGRSLINPFKTHYNFEGKPIFGFVYAYPDSEALITKVI